MTPGRRLVLVAAFLVLVPATTSCRPRRPASAPSTSLSGSKWEGKMNFRGVDYAFKLGFDEVMHDGTLSGEIVWDYYGMRSRVSGRADGNHLVFVDRDRDTKDVVISGSKMEGTDKNGAATFTATRVDEQAQQQQPIEQPVEQQQQRHPVEQQQQQQPRQQQQQQQQQQQ